MSIGITDCNQCGAWHTEYSEIGGGAGKGCSCTKKIGGGERNRIIKKYHKLMDDILTAGNTITLTDIEDLLYDLYDESYQAGYDDGVKSGFEKGYDEGSLQAAEDLISFNDGEL